MRKLPHPAPSQIALTRVLAALGDKIRLSIIGTLVRSKGEVRWGDFEKKFHVGKATLSHHMKTLRLAGLIDHRKEGTRCFVSLRKDIETNFPGLLKAVLKARTRQEE
jgi:DNA-binding transcriptional ArsR family regulator